MEHVIYLSGGCVDGIWTVLVHCSCGEWRVQCPRPNDVERAVRAHIRQARLVG